MHEEIKSMDFLGEIKINDLYYLYKTNSSPINLEILSKLQKFTNYNEFFKHYMNKDIKCFYKNLDNFIQTLSSLINPKNHIKLDSKIDQYISDFSYIYTFCNIIFKLNDSLFSVILNAKNILSELYIKHKLDKNKQDKIDECIGIFLDTFQFKKKSQKLLSKSSTKENSNVSLDINFNSYNENKEFYKSAKQQILIEDLLGKNQENDNSNAISETPRFKEIININPSLANKIEFNNYINLNNEDKNNDFDLKLINQESYDSEFTLSPNKKSNIENEKGKENIINNIEIKSSRKLDDDINDYITSIGKDELIFKHPKPKKSCNLLRQFNSHINPNYSKNNSKNEKTLFSTNRRSNKVIKNFEKNNSYKKMHVSSGHLFIKEESKFYVELLEVIIELYKKNKISFEQKLKLKKLIICKSPKILNIYKYFSNDNENFIKKLKEIIQ